MPFQFNPTVLPQRQQGRGAEVLLQALLSAQNTSLADRELNLKQQDLAQRQQEMEGNQQISRDKLAAEKEIALRSTQVDFIKSALAEGYTPDEIDSLINGTSDVSTNVGNLLQGYLKGDASLSDTLAAMTPGQFRRNKDLITTNELSKDRASDSQLKEIQLGIAATNAETAKIGNELERQRLDLATTKLQGGMTVEDAGAIIESKMQGKQISDEAVREAAKVYGPKLPEAYKATVRDSQLSLHSDVAGDISKFDEATKDLNQKDKLVKASQLINKAKLAGYDYTPFENKLTESYLKLPNSDFGSNFNRIQTIQQFKADNGNQVPIPILEYPDKNDPTYAKVKGFTYGTKEEADQIMGAYQKAYEEKQKFYNKR